MFRNAERTIVEEVAGWISGIATPRDVVRCDYSSRAPVYFSLIFPIRPGKRPRKRLLNPRTGTETFILSFARTAVPDAEQWACIFSHPWGLAVYEKKARHPGALPLRFGFSEEEKRAALEYARQLLEASLSNVAPSQERRLPGRFDLMGDVAVAVWVDGMLRGSCVAEKLRFAEGMRAAAKGAGNDLRFKPLQQNEILRARIEVTFISDLKVPLAASDLLRDELHPGKGYQYDNGRQRGWYLPEVFHVRRFATLGALLESLAKEKARVPRLDHRYIRICDVLDFVENKERSPVTLFPHRNPPAEDAQKALRQSAHAAAQWLMNIQEEDGNFPAVTSIQGTIKVPLDWARLACTGAALAEFAAQEAAAGPAASAERVFAYLHLHLVERKLPVPDRLLPLSYLASMAERKGDAALLIQIAREIAFSISSHPTEPILFSHAAHALDAAAAYDPGLRKEHAKLLALLKSHFLAARKREEDVSLAAWAELIRTFRESDPLFSREVGKWLVDQQAPGGYFPNTPSRRAPYVRGTAKIFEVLATEQEYDAQADQAAGWIMAMQYTQDTVYCVPPAYHQRLVGGFRHDYFNPDVWIDGAAHFLLGAARRLARMGAASPRSL